MAVKYDRWWTHCGGDPLPYDDFEQQDIDSHLRKHGIVLNSDPLVWKFQNNECLLNIIFGFLNADRALIVNSSHAIDINKMPFDGSDEDILKFWGNNTQYFLTSLVDYVGLCFVSISKKKVDEIEQKLSLFTRNRGVIKAKGNEIIGGNVEDKKRWKHSVEA